MVNCLPGCMWLQFSAPTGVCASRFGGYVVSESRHACMIRQNRAVPACRSASSISTTFPPVLRHKRTFGIGLTRSPRERAGACDVPWRQKRKNHSPVGIHLARTGVGGVVLLIHPPEQRMTLRKLTLDAPLWDCGGDRKRLAARLCRSERSCHAAGSAHQPPPRPHVELCIVIWFRASKDSRHHDPICYRCGGRDGATCKFGVGGVLSPAAGRPPGGRRGRSHLRSRLRICPSK